MFVVNIFLDIFTILEILQQFRIFIQLKVDYLFQHFFLLLLCLGNLGIFSLHFHQLFPQTVDEYLIFFFFFFGDSLDHMEFCCIAYNMGQIALSICYWVNLTTFREGFNFNIPCYFLVSYSSCIKCLCRIEFNQNCLSHVLTHYLFLIHSFIQQVIN